jgi:hypothetical protein
MRALILGKSCILQVLSEGRKWMVVWLGGAVRDVVAEETSDVAAPRI